MTDLLLLVPSFIFAGLLWLMERNRAIERQAWELERIALLQRIQAPELAIAQEAAVGEPSEEPLYVSPDHDEAWEDYIEAREAGRVR